MVVAGGGVGVVGGVVGLLVPAVGQGVRSVGRPAVEPLVERNRRAAAGGVEGQVGHSGNAVGAVGGDIHVICGVGGQSRQIDDGVAGIDHGAGADGESRRTPFDGPAGGVAQLIPHDVGLVRGDVGGRKGVHVAAFRRKEAAGCQVGAEDIRDGGTAAVPRYHKKCVFCIDAAAFDVAGKLQVHLVRCLAEAFMQHRCLAGIVAQVQV